VRKVITSKKNAQILLFLLTTCVLSLFTAYASLFGAPRSSEILVTKVSSSSEFYALVLLATLLGGSALLVILLRFRLKLRQMLNYYIALVLFLSVYGLSYTWGGWVYFEFTASTDFPVYLGAVSLVLGAVATVFYLKRRFSVFNLWGVILSVYLASYLALVLQPVIILSVLGALAVYDYIAVYKTKHMVALAELAVSDDYPLPLMVLTGNPKTPEIRHLPDKGGDEVQAMGLGDLVIPSAVVTALFVTSTSFLWMYALFGAVCGTVANNFLLYRLRKPLPALPAISAFILGFIGLGLLLLLA